MNTIHQNIIKWIPVLAVTLVLHWLNPAYAQTKAFPGAEGFGSWSEGGRGGQVLFVTNLNDHGPGSLRTAVESPGPRIIIFRISGSIELESPLVITEPFITIAGQTAPGDGVCIKNYGTTVRNTHDVVIRYLRFRPGDVMARELDALSVYQSQNVMIDNCSASWSTDETLSVTGEGTDSVTVQWCIISESLNNSVHSKGEHGYGSLIRVDGNLTFHHNLYAHHNSRNPRPGTYGEMDRGCLLDFRNNVIYNWGTRAGYSAEDKATLNYVGNYLKPGPSTEEERKAYAFSIGGAATSLFVAGNSLEGYPGKTRDNWQLIWIPDQLTEADVRLPVPLTVAPVHTDPARTSYSQVLAEAGATLPTRDAVDSRVIRQVQTGTGEIIDSQREVGGWPGYHSEKPPVDSDSDGMPDEWENTYDLDSRDPEDTRQDRDGDGYTNIEEYLNGTDPGKAEQDW